MQDFGYIADDGGIVAAVLSTGVQINCGNLTYEKNLIVSLNIAYSHNLIWEKSGVKMYIIEKYRVLLLMKKQFSGIPQCSNGSPYSIREHKTALLRGHVFFCNIFEIL